MDQRITIAFSLGLMNQTALNPAFLPKYPHKIRLICDSWMSFKVSGRFLSLHKYRHSLLSLTFNHEVTITEYYIPDFSISSFFADLGGSLGLWLGVGFVQLLGNWIQFMSWIRSKIKII